MRKRKSQKPLRDNVGPAPTVREINSSPNYSNQPIKRREPKMKTRRII